MQTTSPFRRGKRPSTRLSSPARRTNVPLTLPPSTIDQRAARALERAVLCPRDEVLGIGLERDVVQLRQAADRDPLTGQANRRRFGDSGT